MTDDPTPREVLAEVASIRQELDAFALWCASIELDGEAATVRRALDVALGEGPPIFLEVGPGQVLELDTRTDTGDPDA